MARGKQTCRILKEIRRQIAESNDIDYVTSECRFKGDCLGTCPKCEAEVRYLEQQLRLRALAGKAVVLAGISTGILSMTACGNGRNVPPVQTMTHQTMATETIVAEGSSVTTSHDATPDTPTSEAEATGRQSNRTDAKTNAVDVVDIDELMKEGGIATFGEVPPCENDSVMMPEENNHNASATDMKEEAYEITEERIFGMSNEQDPQFPGGQAALIDWVQTHVHYPDSLRENNVGGRVVMQFDIDETGAVSNVRVARRSAHPVLDAEAVKVIKALPKFTPGKLNGKPVRCVYTLPVAFKKIQ